MAFAADSANIVDMDTASSWAYDSVCGFAQAGITVGDADGFFNPQRLITFGEFAAIIENIKVNLSQPALFPVMPVEEPLPPDGEVVPPDYGDNSSTDDENGVTPENEATPNNQTNEGNSEPSNDKTSS